jgi:hypothetical protein
MRKFRQIVALLASFAVLNGAHADVCQQADVQEIDVEINTSKIIRANAPKELFGFNIPWASFQIGYFRNGLVRPELIELLAHFKGAAYRYPGGSPSNWFEWQKAVGPMAKRAKMHYEYDRYALAEFGLAEFADFVAAVNGRAILTLNVVGPYKKAPLSPTALAADTVEILNHVRNHTSFGCVGGTNCGVMAWELGNELDQNPYNWPASIYVKRTDVVISAVTDLMPEVQWIANGRSAPWDPNKSSYSAFNASLADGLADRVRAIAIHPYYDGIDIPAATRYVTEFGKSWANARNGGKVFVTEHAVWPTVPVIGRWESNWHQANDIGGAISTADFLLVMFGNPQVASANWHALGVEGPWQLVRWDRTKDIYYPSPVYWGLRTLREAYLTHVVQTHYKQPSGATYSGGYDIRVVGMISEDGQTASVLGVNRKAKPLRLRVLWSGVPRKAGASTFRAVSGLSPSEDNTDIEPQKVTMKTITNNLLSRRSASVWCVPANSVFSIVEP